MFRGSINVSIARTISAHFIIRGSTLIRSILVPTPIGQALFYVLKADTLFLLCLQDIDQLGVYYNNMTNTVINNRTGQVLAQAIRKHNYAWLT